MSFSIQCESCGFNNKIGESISFPVVQVEVVEGLNPTIGTHVKLTCPRCADVLQLIALRDFVVINKSLNLRQNDNKSN